MSRSVLKAELGLEILGLNEDTGVSILKGSALPGNDSGLQDASSIGSMYLRDTGEIYQKIANAGAEADWERYAKLSDVQALDWKKKVKVLTADAAPIEGAVKDATTFSDNDAPSLSGSDFSVGDRIIFGNGGTPKIGEVSGISSDDLTITYIGVEALATNHTFVVDKYLPDSANQENQAIIHYDGSATLIKLADVDWALATGINLSGSYVPSAGNVVSGDTVEAAVAKLDGNLDNASSILGADVQSDSDMGAYSGGILTDNQDAKANIQELSDHIEAQPIPVPSSVSGITTVQTIAEVVVDDIRASKYLVSITLVSDESKMESFELLCGHDGTSSSDASNVDDTLYAKLKLGGGVVATVLVDLNGAGAAQTMRLRVSAPSAVNVKATRIDVAI